MCFLRVVAGVLFLAFAAPKATCQEADSEQSVASRLKIPRCEMAHASQAASSCRSNNREKRTNRTTPRQIKKADPVAQTASNRSASIRLSSHSNKRPCFGQ